MLENYSNTIILDRFLDTNSCESRLKFISNSKIIEHKFFLHNHFRVARLVLHQNNWFVASTMKGVFSNATSVYNGVIFKFPFDTLADTEWK